MVYIIKSNYYRLIKEKISKLTNGIDKDNISYFDLTIDNIKDIIEECNYTSLFDDKKAVIVYNTNIFSTKFEYKEDLEVLEKYLNNINKNTILIFIADSVSLKKKCVKIIKDNNSLFELSIKEDELESKVKEYLKNNNFKIENIALNKLINNLNNNYDYILNELDKVMIIKKDYLITLENINKYTISIENNNIFDFVDVIIKKDNNKIFKYLEEYIDNKEEPAILFSNIANQYRLIYTVKKIYNKYDEKTLSSLLDIHPYRIKLARENGYNYTIDELKEKLLYIGELDEKIKLGYIDKYVALKLFLLNI